MSLGQAEEMLDARRLHTHFGQDGGIFNGDTPKFCALSILRNRLLLRPLTSRPKLSDSIMSLYDMNKRTGAT